MDVPFPDEILHEILSYSISISHSEFLKFYRSSRSTHPSPCTSLLLVSKRWLRVGTPLVYECVRITDAKQTTAVAQLFRAQPQVGRAVRCLRLEGGLGKDLEHIAKATPRLESLYISLRIKSADSIAGLKKALPLLRPRRLYLEKTLRWKSNKKIAEVQGVLEGYIRDSGSPLKFVTLSAYFCGMDEALAGALSASAVEEFSCNCDLILPWIDIGFMHTISQGSNMQRVICRRESPAYDTEIRQHLQTKGSTDEDIQKFLFVYDDDD